MLACYINLAGSSYSTNEYVSEVSKITFTSMPKYVTNYFEYKPQSILNLKATPVPSQDKVNALTAQNHASHQ